MRDHQYYFIIRFPREIRLAQCKRLRLAPKEEAPLPGGSIHYIILLFF